MDLLETPRERDAMSQRMFAAIELPDRITDALADLNPRLPGLRWLPASMQHLTLVFLAAVPEEALQRLIESLDAIDMPPFALELTDLGTFGRRRNPTVVWTGVAEPPPALYQLQRRVRDAALAAGLEMDDKPFRPHVTLARCKGLSKQDLRPLIEAHRESAFGAFEVTGFALFASELHPDGARHERVFRRDFEPA